MDDRENILSANNEKLTDEDLLRYLNGTLSEEERNKIEIKITGSFESDAVEGLNQIRDKNQIPGYVKQLNQKLPQILRHKKRWSKKKELKELQWILVAIIILLLLCIMSYLVIRMHHKTAFTSGKRGIINERYYNFSNS